MCIRDRQVVAVDVLVLEDKIRLVSETEPFQIIAGDILQLNIGQYILRMRVERDMHYRFLHFHLRRHESLEALHRLADVHLPRTVIVDAVGGEQPPQMCIRDRLLVVLIIRGI